MRGMISNEVSSCWGFVWAHVGVSCLVSLLGCAQLSSSLLLELDVFPYGSLDGSGVETSDPKRDAGLS